MQNNVIIFETNNTSVFKTLGEAVMNAKPGSEIKLGPGIYIEPKNSPLAEISKEIKITGCTEDIASKDFSELAIVVLNEETSCKICSDAVIEGVVFTNDENIHFKTINDYLSKTSDFFPENKAADDEVTDFEENEDNELDLNFDDNEDYYSLLHVEGNAKLKNIAVLKSRNIGVMFTSGEGRLKDSVVALSTKDGIAISDACQPNISFTTIQGNYSTGISVVDRAEPKISNCRIFDNKGTGVFIYNQSKPEITKCKIYDNKTEGEDYSGVEVSGFSDPSIWYCEIYGNLKYGLFINQFAKGSYKYCDIHDNYATGIYVDCGNEPAIENCRIHDNKTEGKKYPGVEIVGNSNPGIISCEIYNHLGNGIVIKDNAKGSYKDCNIHGNKEYGFNIAEETDPIISGSKIYDNKEG